MTPRQKLALLVVVPVIVAAVLIIQEVTAPEPGTVEYHLDRYSEARKDRSFEWAPRNGAKVTDYLYPTTWIWLYRGRPTISSCIQQMETHRQALLKLGYFEQRNYPMTQEQFFSLKPKLKASSEVLSFAFKRGGTEDATLGQLEATGPKTEMSAIEEIVLKHFPGAK